MSKKMVVKRKVRKKIAAKKQWRDNVVDVVRKAYTDLYDSPITNDSANYSVPVYWTKTGVTMWKSFVEAVTMENDDPAKTTESSKEAAVATAILTSYLQQCGFVALCSKIEHHVINERKSVEELKRTRSQLLDSGVLGEGQDAEKATYVENAPKQEEARSNEEGNGTGAVEG